MAPYSTRLILRRTAVLSFYVAIGFAVAPRTTHGQSQPLADAETNPIETVDYVMYQSPELPSITSKVIVADAAIPLWLDALSRPESRLQRMAIDTFAIAHHRGMEGLEQAIPSLLEKLQSEDDDRQVRLAAARALIAMDVRQHAETLAEEASQMDIGFRLAVEAALARWGSDRMTDIWLRRLEEPSAGQAELRIAIDGLANSGVDRAVKPLLRHARNTDQLPAIRLAAARSVGKLQTSGLVDEAQGMLATESVKLIDQLVALGLLGAHDDPATVSLLENLLTADETTVQAIALERLYQIDPQMVVPWIDRLITSDDSNIRWTLARAMVATDDAEHIGVLAQLLDDVHPQLRRYAARSLVSFAQASERRDEVLAETAGILDGDSWRGCEQAIIVMVNLDHKPAGDRMSDLLHHSRGEVMTTAAWGLRRLALEKYLPAMLGRAKEVQVGFSTGKFSLSDPGYDDQIAQLFLGFGQLRFGQAESVMREYVPRNIELGERSRAAAIWALGMLYEDKAKDDLIDQFTKRLNDIDGLIPEVEDVRRMSAISLGRMNAEAALPSLRKHGKWLGETTGQACWWAIERITDEKRPPLPPPSIDDYGDWFLAPLDR